MILWDWGFLMNEVPLCGFRVPGFGIQFQWLGFSGGVERLLCQPFRSGDGRGVAEAGPGLDYGGDRGTGLRDGTWARGPTCFQVACQVSFTEAACKVPFPTPK